MNRNRTTDPAPKQSSIASISSNVPLMATNNENQYTTDVQSFLNSFKTTTTNRDSKRGRTVVQPKGTVLYTVANSDTLEKVALRYDLTPSELLQLNKLSTRIVFPGQTLFVPEAPSSTSSPLPLLPSATVSTQPKDDNAFHLDRRLSNDLSPPSNAQDGSSVIWSMSRQPAAKPGHAQRLKSDTSTESDSSPRTIEERLKTQKEDNTRQVQHIQRSLSVEESQQLDDECLQRFIKVNVRLMTDDHKTVAGTLLVTPNAVMFDPDVLDPLVKEHGIDQYGLIIRMDFLAGIALYEDIAMYEHEATLRDEEKRKMCHSTSIKSLHQPVPLRSNTDSEQIRELLHSLVEKVEQESHTSTDSSLVLFNASASRRQRVSSSELNENLFQAVEETKHSSGILVDEQELSSQGYPLENCTPVDRLNQRFGEIDKLLQKQHEHYVNPHPIEIPYYLCVKTSVLTNTVALNQERQNKKHIDNIYGKKELEREYWFSVPKDKSDHLYAFFLRWSPDRSLDPIVDEEPKRSNHSTTSSPSKSAESPSVKGFVLLANEDPELTDDYMSTKNKNNNSSKARSMTASSENAPDGGKQPHYLKRQNTLLKEWEIINVDEIQRRIHVTHASPAAAAELEIPPPKLLSPSTLINEQQSKQIMLELPVRVHGLNWQMLFSTEANGFSLNQLYRRSMEVDQDTPALLLVKDVEQNIFGGYISQQLMVSEGFYGTGESFLFTFHPDFQVFHWTGNNQFFIKGDGKFLGVGSGGGTYGLWLDADLYHGRTCPSKTFNNVRLSTKEDFIIASVEVWTFSDR